MRQRIGTGKTGRIEIGEIGDPLFFPRESPLVNALYKAYVDVTGDTEHEPMVIGGGTYAKSLKNIIAFGPEKMGMDYHIHSADEFILVSEMEEAVLIYMEAILEKKHATAIRMSYWGRELISIVSFFFSAAFSFSNFFCAFSNSL